MQFRICARCGLYLPLRAFLYVGSEGVGLAPLFQECVAIIRREIKRRAIEDVPAAGPPMTWGALVDEVEALGFELRGVEEK